MNTFNARLSFKGEGELTVTLPVIGQISIWAGRDIYLKGATQEIIETLRQYRSIKLEHKLNGDVAGCYRVIEVNAIDRIPQNAFRPVAAPKAEHISDLKAQMMKANEITGFDAGIIEAGQSTAEELKAQQEAKELEEKAKIEKEAAKKLKAEKEAQAKNKELEDKKEEPKVITSTGETEEDLAGESVSKADAEKVQEEKVTVENKEKPKTLPKDLANIKVTTGKEKGKKLGELDERALRKLARYSTKDTEKENAKKVLEILFPKN